MKKQIMKFDFRKKYNIALPSLVRYWITPFPKPISISQRVRGEDGGGLYLLGKPCVVCFFLFVPALILTFSLPGWANLGNVWLEFQAYSNDARNYLSNQVNSRFNPFQATVNTAINSASADLRIPNPNTTNQDLINQISQYPIPDKYENNSVLRAINTSYNLDQAITRSAIEGTLGSGGQSRMKNKLENTQNSVQQVNILVETATTNKQQKQIEIQAAANSMTGLNIDNLNPVTSAFSSILNNQAKLTQLTWEGLADLELQNLNLQQEQTKILAANLGTNIQIQQDLQYSNLNLTNLAAEVVNINRDRRIETASNAANLLRIATQANLLQTQIDNQISDIQEIEEQENTDQGN